MINTFSIMILISNSDIFIRWVSLRKANIIEALKRSKKIRREDIIEWLNRKYNANLPRSATWSRIANFIQRKVSVKALEEYAKRKGVI